jgi:hypothetical protein
MYGFRWLCPGQSQREKLVKWGMWEVGRNRNIAVYPGVEVRSLTECRNTPGRPAGWEGQDGKEVDRQRL